MPFILTEESLTAAVISYTNRSDERFVANIPIFYTNAQRVIATRLKVLGLKQTENGFLIPTQNTIIKDVRWLVNDSMNIRVGPNFTQVKQLYHRSIEFCNSYWPTPSLTDEPVYYTSEANQTVYYFVPTPDLAYPYQSIFYATPQLLDQEYDQNFLTTGMPRLLLYGTLLETAPFLQDDSRLPTWEREFYKELRAQGWQDEERSLDVQGSMGDQRKETTNAR